jgi:hypothetical protein
MLELMCIGKEIWPNLEARMESEDPAKSYHVVYRATDSDQFNNRSRANILGKLR